MRKLDRAGAAVRIRLNNIVVRARNAKEAWRSPTPQASGGAVIGCAAKHCVFASWNMMIPYIVTELPAAQKAAMHALIKTPLVYTSVAIKNWTSFKKLGIKSVMRPAAITPISGSMRP